MTSVPALAAVQAVAPTACDDRVPLRRFERERAARKHAEQLLTEKSRELFDALQASRDAQRRLQFALWGSGEGVWEWRAETGLLRVDGLLVDARPIESAGKTLNQLLGRIHGDDRASFQLSCQLHFNGSRPDIDTAFRIRIGAAWRWLRVRGRALERDGSSRPLTIYGTVKDVTDQRQAEHALHLLAEAFASTLDALVVVDARWHIVQTNQSFRALAGLQALPSGEPLSTFLHLPAEARDGDGPWLGESRLLRGDRPAVPVEVSVTMVAEQAGQGRCHIVVMRDISERQRQATALRRLAREDTLTGLPNRGALEAELSERIGARQAFTLLFLDLDGFKAINDGFGHGAGDMLLRQVSQRLRLALPQAYIARWGGDELVVLGPPGGGESELQTLADAIRREVGRPCPIEGHMLRVTASVGAVCHPAHGSDAQTLLRRADMAMYAAKEGSKDHHVVFHEALDVGAQRRMQMQALLRADAERNAFHYVLQPKVDASGRHVGAELLMRWQPAAFGPVSPTEFIPIAEQIGVIDLLGRHALRAAARVAREARELGGAMTVAVNRSPRQLLRSDLEQTVVAACLAERCDPRWLELELTESALISDIQLVTGLLVRLRGHGFGLALDDFGTGYSSLSHLRSLPFHKVKIDRSFVQDLTAEPRSRLILEGIVRLCRSVGLTTVAEGVETGEQFGTLREIGVDEFQGYLFARPQPQAQWFETLGQQLRGEVARPGMHA